MPSITRSWTLTTGTAFPRVSVEMTPVPDISVTARPTAGGPIVWLTVQDRGWYRSRRPATRGICWFRRSAVFFLSLSSTSLSSLFKRPPRCRLTPSEELRVGVGGGDPQDWSFATGWVRFRPAAPGDPGSTSGRRSSRINFDFPLGFSALARSPDRDATAEHWTLLEASARGGWSSDSVTPFPRPDGHWVTDCRSPVVNY